jgi:hypothetical protein
VTPGIIDPVNAIIYTRTEAIPAHIVERTGDLCRLKGLYDDLPSDGVLLVELRDGESKVLLEACEVIAMQRRTGELTIRAGRVTNVTWE